MKAPAAYKELAARRLPLLLQIRAIREQLDAMDAPIVDELERYYSGLNWAHPRQAAEN